VPEQFAVLSLITAGHGAGHEGCGTGYGGSGNLLVRGKMHNKSFRWKNLKEATRKIMYRRNGCIKDLKQIGLCRLNLSGLGHGQVAGSFEHYHERLGYIKSYK
jgi:hypothetical protein